MLRNKEDVHRIAGKYPHVRADIITSIYNYAANHRPVGGFLQAVIRNDLKEACGRADDDNLLVLSQIVQIFYAETPAGCWGSEEHYGKWLAKRKA